MKVVGLDRQVSFLINVSIWNLRKSIRVRTKYIFQQKHDEKNDFLGDFTMVDAFLIGNMERSTEQRVSWHNEMYKTEPRRYGIAVSLGHLLYSTQWKGTRTVVTHALTGENGAITHEIEYVSVDLEPWEDQITKEQEGAPRTCYKLLQRPRLRIKILIERIGGCVPSR